jgi:hypothetical protein
MSGAVEQEETTAAINSEQPFSSEALEGIYRIEGNGTLDATDAVFAKAGLRAAQRKRLQGMEANCHASPRQGGSTSVMCSKSRVSMACSRIRAKRCIG